MATMNPILTHYDWLENASRGLDLRAAVAFGAACAERQWPVYVRASAGKPWEKRALLRTALDSIWRWLFEIDSQRPSGYFAACEEASLESVQRTDESVEAASRVVVSWLELLHGLETGDANACKSLGECNLNLLHSFIYFLLDIEVSSDNEFVVGDHQLVRQEIKRQQDDLTLLRTRTLQPSVAREIFGRSQGQSMFGDYWYD